MLKVKSEVQKELAPEAEEFFRRHREEWCPFFETHGKPGWFSGVDGVKIHYRSFINPQAKATVLVLAGRGENISKHPELAHELFHQGFSVHLMDFRGQGLSGRMTTDPQVGHVERFSDYVDDVETMWDKVIGNVPGPRFMFCHSLGGLVASYLAERRPGFLKGMVLCAPMFGIEFHPLPEWLGLALARVLCLMGRGRHFAPSCGPFNPAIPLETNFWTRCRHRYMVNQEQQRRMPETVIGGPSNRWIDTCAAATRRVDELARNQALPILLFQAECETIVRNEAQDRFCALAPQCRKIVLPLAWHEALSEVEETRSVLMGEALAFMNELSRP